MSPRLALDRVASRLGVDRALERVAARVPAAAPLARTYVRLLVRAAVGVTAGILVAGGALVLDAAIGWSLPFDADRVQSLLNTLTGASLTIAVFALWMRSVVVSLVASTFHARTLASFLDDGFQRATASWMVAAFTVLVTVAVASPATDAAQVPPFATVLALATVVSALLGVLLAIRDATQRLDTSELVHLLADRGFRTLEETARIPDDEAPTGVHQPVRAIDAETVGWVRHVDRQAIVAHLPGGAGAELHATPGTFVSPGLTLLTVDTSVDEDTADRLRGAIEVGRVRDPDSDLAFSIEELTDVALHAAGPGDDIGTAREALLYLEALLDRLLERGTPTGHLRVGDRTLTSATQPRVADLLGRAAERLRHARATDPATTRFIRRMLERLAAHAEELGDHDTLALLRDERGTSTSDRGRHTGALADDEHGRS